MPESVFISSLLLHLPFLLSSASGAIQLDWPKPIGVGSKLIGGRARRRFPYFFLSFALLRSQFWAAEELFSVSVPLLAWWKITTSRDDSCVTPSPTKGEIKKCSVSEWYYSNTKVSLICAWGSNYPKVLK